MSSISKYQNLALDWNPGRNSNKQFTLIVSIVSVFILALGLTLSSIELPKPERQATPNVPDRIARFIVQKKKAKVIKPKLKPVQKIKPKPIPKPRLKKHKPKSTQQQKPLTKKQQKARKVAESSGLLALSNELESLMDTNDIAETLNAEVLKTSPESSKAAALNTDILTAGADMGSGGVDSNKLVTVSTKNTQLTKLERSSLNQTLHVKGHGNNAQSGEAGSGEGRSKSSSFSDEEEVSIVFDQNKSKLYSLYSRAKRKNPGLKGKIVFQLTINKSGKVTDISILSSELNDPALEKRLLSRIKMFNFGTINTDTLVVTYPIEFLPAY